jgi:hypothetical protein
VIPNANNSINIWFWLGPLLACLFIFFLIIAFYYKKKQASKIVPDNVASSSN